MPPTIVLVHGASPSHEHARPDRARAGLGRAEARRRPARSPSATPDRPTLAERLGETVPLISAPAFFGPPVIFLLGPWLLLVLLLIPPAAVLITLVAVMLLGAGLLAALGALIASPYLLVRHLRARQRIAHPAPAVSEAPAPAANGPSTHASFA
jgi:hypothetical protein